MQSLRFSGRAAVCAILFATPVFAQDVTLGDVLDSSDRHGNIVSVRTATAVVRLEFCTSTMVRVRYGFPGRFADDETVMVVARTWPPVRLRARDAGDSLVFAADQVSVRVAKAPLRVSFQSRDGSRLTVRGEPGQAVPCRGNPRTGKRYEGARTIGYQAPLDVLPLLVGAGAILPMQPDMAYAGEKPVDPLTLDVFPSGRSRFVLYEDDGISLEYQKGVHSRTAITCRDDARRTGVRVEAPVGKFAVAPRAYVFRLHLNTPPRQVRINGQVVRRVDPGQGAQPGQGSAWNYEATTRTLVAGTDPAHRDLTARVEVSK